MKLFRKRRSKAGRSGESVGGIGPEKIIAKTKATIGVTISPTATIIIRFLLAAMPSPASSVYRVPLFIAYHQLYFFAGSS